MSRNERVVAVLSSGFMTYPRGVHPQYVHLRRYIEESPTTLVLLPSLDYDVCVAETVRRQLARPFSGSREKEEAVIRERFALYVSLRARKIETMRPLTAIVEELARTITAVSRKSENCTLAGRGARQQLPSRHRFLDRIASYLPPARRASRIDPLIALRDE